MKTEVKPYQSEENKKTQVKKMFNTIAHRYDFLNILLSFGIDRTWRRKAVRIIAQEKPVSILDVATGTGDLAILLHKRTKTQEIMGIDISENMLEQAKKKVHSLHLPIHFQVGDAEALEFPENSFDAITVGFGVRNFQDLQQGINELFRVLKPGGQLLVLEFSKPKKAPVKQLYNIYSHTLLPLLGRLGSGHKNAYSYLPNSINAFPDGEQFIQYLKTAGFTSTNQKLLSSGIASIYLAKKQ